MQQIAGALDLPTTASGSDLLVMVCGKLCDDNNDLSNVRVVATKTEGGKELSLQDMDGVFLRVPVLKEELSGASLAPGSKVSVPTLVSGSSRTSLARDSAERKSFSLEEKHVEEVLSLMETELTNTLYTTAVTISSGRNSVPEKGFVSITSETSGSPRVH